MNITPHFTRQEMGIPDNNIGLLANAMFLCRWVLEPIRNHINAPLVITSGYRSDLANNHAHGVSNSEHLYLDDHAAADFTPATQELFDWIRLESGLPFRQVILEHDASNTPRCIHISCRRNGNDKREALVGMTNNQGWYKSVEVA